MVQLLGSALDLPLEERNALHVAAGFVPPYGDKGLAAENLQPVRQALDFILRQQEPYPGIVDRRPLGCSHPQSGVGATVQAVSRFIRDGNRRLPTMPCTSFSIRRGLRQFIVNWDEFARQLIQILHRDVAQGSRAAAQLLDEIMAYPGLSADWRLPRQFGGVLAGHDDATRQGRLSSRASFPRLRRWRCRRTRRCNRSRSNASFRRTMRPPRRRARWRFDSKTQGDKNATCSARSSIDRDDE